jgi:chemotaxis protein MotB
MSRRQRQDSATAAELRAMGVSTSPGRGWRILALLVLIGGATFMAAYYLPLYRAHGQLNSEYAKLSKAATSDRQKLADTVKALQSVSSQRDELEKGPRAERARAERMSSVSRELELKLSAASAKKLIQIDSRGGMVNVMLTGSSLFSRNGAELNAAGKSLLCLVSSSPTRGRSLRYEVWAQQSSAKGAASGLQTAVALAGSAAATLAESCKVDPGAITVRASAEQQTEVPSAPLSLRLEAAPDVPEPVSHRGPGG